MEIKVIKDSKISRRELANIASAGFGDIVKAVVDVEQEIMAVGGELHADEEVLLFQLFGSKRENTWGINFYPKNSAGADWIEFDSLINLKPSRGNRSRSVEDPGIREKIMNIVQKLVFENG